MDASSIAGAIPASVAMAKLLAGIGVSALAEDTRKWGVPTSRRPNTAQAPLAWNRVSKASIKAAILAGTRPDAKRLVVKKIIMLPAKAPSVTTPDAVQASSTAPDEAAIGSSRPGTHRAMIKVVAANTIPASSTSFSAIDGSQAKIASIIDI